MSVSGFFPSPWSTFSLEAIPVPVQRERGHCSPQALVRGSFWFTGILCPPPTGMNSARTHHVLSSWAGIHHSCPQSHHDLQPAGLHIHILLIYISDSFGSASWKCLATWAHLVASSCPCWGVGISETLPCPLAQSLLCHASQSHLLYACRAPGPHPTK